MAKSPAEIIAKLETQEQQLLDYLAHRRNELQSAVEGGRVQLVQAELDEFMFVADKLLLVHKTKKSLLEDRG